MISSSNIKIVHFTSVHPLDDSRILYKQCQSLANKGYNVTLIGCGVTPNDSCNVNIYSISKKQNFIKRILFTNFFIIYKAKIKNAAIYHFHDPELIPYALILRAFGHKVIFDAHEDLSLQINYKFWIPKYFKKPLSYLSKCIYSVADWFMSGIITVTPTLVRQFSNKNTILIRNFPILNEFSSINVADINERNNNLVYIGGITKFRGINENISVVNKIKNELNTTLLIGGRFQSSDFEEEIKQLDLKKVKFKGWLSREGVKNLLNNSKIGLLTLHPTSNYYDAYPIKMFEYMAAGIPVIASDFPVYKGIIEKAKCGILVDPFDIEKTTQEVERLLNSPKLIENYSKNGRLAAERFYNWQSEEVKLLELYKKLTN